MTAASVIFAILAFILRSLLAYSARRFQMVETIHLDISERVNTLLHERYVINDWWNNLSPDTTDFQIPVVSEEHFFYKNSQNQISYALWSREEKLVREAYRNIRVSESLRDAIIQHAQYWDQKKISERKENWDQFNARASVLIEYFNSMVCKLFTDTNLNREIKPAKVATIKETGEHIKNIRKMTVRLTPSYSRGLFLRRSCAYITFSLIPILIMAALIIYTVFLSNVGGVTPALDGWLIGIPAIGFFVNAVVFYIICIKSPKWAFSSRNCHQITGKDENNPDSKAVVLL